MPARRSRAYTSGNASHDLASSSDKIVRWSVGLSVRTLTNWVCFSGMTELYSMHSYQYASAPPRARGLEIAPTTR